MKIVRAHGGNTGAVTVAVPALTGSQMAVFIISVWGGPSGVQTNAARSYGGNVSISGTNLQGNSVIYAMTAGSVTGTYGGTIGNAVAPPAFITTSTGNQDITVTGTLSVSGSEILCWNGIMCIYNPPF